MLVSNRLLPYNPITFSTVTEIVRKLKLIGSMNDKICSGRSLVVFDELREMVFEKTIARPQNSS